MNISGSIIGLLILGLFLLPVVLIAISSGKNKAKRLLNDLHAEALKNSLTVSESDSWNESAIGIDSMNNKVIFLDESRGDKNARIFSLKDVKAFKTFPDLLNKKSNNYQFKNEARLALSFVLIDVPKSEINVTFYQTGFGGLTKKEQQLFEKWSGIIRKKME